VKRQDRGKPLTDDDRRDDLGGEPPVRFEHPVKRRFVEGGAALKDGSVKPADLIVLATGFVPQERVVAKLLGDEVAKKVGPVWGFGPRRRTVNATLQEALANWNGKLPDGIALALAGHIHVVEVLSFTDKRSPQFVLGTGGTLLAGKIKANLNGETIAGRRVAYGRSDHRFGFAMIEPAEGGWAATFHDTSSAKLFSCKIAAGQIGCD